MSASYFSGEQPSLFDKGTEMAVGSGHLGLASGPTPSEEFQVAHPEYTRAVVEVNEWDPNTRRAQQLESVGGGLCAAVSGELNGGSQRPLASSIAALQHRYDEKTRRIGLDAIEIIRGQQGW